MKNPTPKDLEVCMDGIGAAITDASVHHYPTNKGIVTRKFTVRYIIPTVSSNDAESQGVSHSMGVAAASAEDAVRTVLAAHPTADISSVE